MRRFVDTFAGKALCHLAVMALVLPTVTLTVARRAEAQVTQLPSWAVTEFKDLKGNASLKYGQIAADAVSTELAKTNRYDVVPQESVKRAIETLGVSSPPEGLVNLSRVGQDVFGAARGGTIVAGEIIDYQVKAVGGGKQALVAVRMVAYDVVSGLPVNGALEKGESTIRSGNVTNETLVTDAIQQAAAVAVRTMQGQQLPNATVLNTTTLTALLNQGSRSGFKSGDTVIITRGAVQVGTGRIGQIEPDQAEMTYERVKLGVAPGDTVRAVFSPPPLPTVGSIFTNEGGIRVSGKPRGRSNNATLISALLVVGLVAVLLGANGNGSSNTATADLRAEATLQGDTPAVLISWSANGFFKGSGTSGNGLARWQIYRGLTAPNPNLVVDGAVRSVFDSAGTNSNNDTYPGQYFKGGVNNTGQIGGFNCDNQSLVGLPRAASIPATPGQANQYAIEAVYEVTSLDIPSNTGTTSTAGSTGSTASTGTTGTAGATGTTTSTTSTTGSTATTATTATAGSTATTATTGTTSTTSTTTTGGATTSTGSTTGGTTSGSGTTSGAITECFFQSGRSHTGLATPLPRPTVTAPTNVNTAPVVFRFTSSAALTGDVLVQSVLEISDDFQFRKKYTVSFAATTPNAASISVASGINKSLTKTGIGGVSLSAVQQLYYRVGVRNINDKPGPLKDPNSGERYIYTAPAVLPTRVLGTSSAVITRTRRP